MSIYKIVKCLFILIVIHNLKPGFTTFLLKQTLHVLGSSISVLGFVSSDRDQKALQ